MQKSQKYPVDVASFKRIRTENYLYVDKTGFIDKLAREGVYYFLARPRRFGKSLLLNSLKEYFNGNKNLFKGLKIEELQPGEWARYPILHFNLSGRTYSNPESLTLELTSQLEILEKEYEVQNPQKGNDIDSRFHELIINLKARKGNPVVILIDEYDAPLSSSIGKPELQEIYREQLHGFYSVLKKAEEYIRFCMLTGVTRYGKVSIFSGMNNLRDITFSDEYAAVCGITEEELHEYYSEGAEQLAAAENVSIEKVFELLKFNYDGYHFSKSLLDVYNPYSINNALADKEIHDYWCQSGIPTILSKSLLENDFDVDELNGMEVMENTLSDLSMYTNSPVPLLYQTGYLTLKAYHPEDRLFTIGYPNREVEKGILNNILSFYNPGNRGDNAMIVFMRRSLIQGNPKEFLRLLSSFLSSIPVPLRKRVARYENYYHTIFYCIVKLVGMDTQAEYATSEGYIDIVIKTNKFIYIIELKINGTAEDALQQIENKHYGREFESASQHLFKIGIGFSKETNTIDSLIIQ